LKKEKEKIDVVFLGRFSEDEILSGQEKTAKRIFTEHTKFFKSTFIQYFFDGNKYGLLKKVFGKEIIKTPGGSEVLTLGLFKLLTELYKRKPAIIHIITFERFAALSLFCKTLFRTKIIYSIHGVIAYENDELKKINSFLKLRDRFCERMFFKHSGTLIFYSENSIDIAEKYFQIDESKAVILSGGIDGQFYNKEKRTAKTGNLKLILHFLNILKESSREFLKELMMKLDFPVEIYIIGNENESPGQINQKVLVKFINKLNASDLVNHYKDADIFLSLNKYDTFSISTVEAMASGLVPVVTEDTGMSRYIEEGTNGFTVKYGDADSLLNILNKLNNERVLIEKISNKAHEIYEILSWQNVYDTYRIIYSSLVK
jgi:glycosyltransferase involved in cell wall biosynthesis